MDKEKIDALMVSGFKKVNGISAACPLAARDRGRIIEIERDAENRSLMGLGRVINTGVRQVLTDERVYVLLTNMDFEWGCHATLVLKKGHDIVGREIRDKKEIERLSGRRDVWFMHRNFIVFKDRISFPRDIMKKNCHFEIPGIEEAWCRPNNDIFHYRSAMFANPATPSDVYLKEQYFQGVDERGLGTVLVGISLERRK